MDHDTVKAPTFSSGAGAILDGAALAELERLRRRVAELEEEVAIGYDRGGIEAAQLSLMRFVGPGKGSVQIRFVANDDCTPAWEAIKAMGARYDRFSTDDGQEIESLDLSGRYGEDVEVCIQRRPR